MSENNSTDGFRSVVVCENPMEVELFPATLREHEIPHRTEWLVSGQLTVMVPNRWQNRAMEVLNEASRVFFGHDLTKRHVTTSNLPVEFSQLGPKKVPSATAQHAQAQLRSVPAPEEDQDDDLFAPSFMDDAGAVSPDEVRIRPVWPATVLSLIPGTGLGHLYAGRFQIFFYLIFCSLLGALFFRYTGSYWALLLVGFSWLMDLMFATVHVRTQNERAQQALTRSQQAERRFLQSMESNKRIPHDGTR